MNFKFFKLAVSKVCLAAMLAVAITVLVSCGNEMVTGDVDPEKPTMVGLWRGVSFDVNNNDNWIDITSEPHDEFAFTVEFRDDGSFEGTGYLGNGGGTYTESGNSITVYKDGSVYAQYSIKELNYNDAYVVVVMTPAIFSFRLMRVNVSIKPWDQVDCDTFPL